MTLQGRVKAIERRWPRESVPAAPRPSVTARIEALTAAYFAGEGPPLPPVLEAAFAAVADRVGGAGA